MREWICSVMEPLNREWKFIAKQELVRCKDCKHWYFADNRIPCEQGDVCGLHGIDVTQDWFCADGERQEGGEVNE